MPARQDPIDRGRIRGDEQVRRFARELRDARIGRGLSQRQVATAVGISRSALGRIETCKSVDVPVRLACMLGSVVGLDVYLGTYPGPTHLRDAAQLRVGGRFVPKLGPAWAWQYEVQLPMRGDQRAWDAAAVHSKSGLCIAVEVETRITDVQALLRRLALKRRDGQVTRLVVVVADTLANRLAIREAGDVVRTAFPCGARRALARLAAGEDPGADALIMV